MATLPAKKKSAPAPVQKTARTPAKPTRTVAKTSTPSPAKPLVNKTTAVNAAKADRKKDKPEKVKVVRDSFTIPKTEYAQIAVMKKRAIDQGMEAKKSELIRAGLALLMATTDAAFRKALGNVPTLKTGRPGKA